MRTAQELSEQIASMEQQLQAAKRQRTLPSAATTAELSYGPADRFLLRSLASAPGLTLGAGSSSSTLVQSS